MLIKMTPTEQNFARCKNRDCHLWLPDDYDSDNCLMQSFVRPNRIRHAKHRELRARKGDIIMAETRRERDDYHII